MSERNRKLAEWCGWKPGSGEKSIANVDPEYWVNPVGDGYYLTDELPDYENSLDACMELVEKAAQTGREYFLIGRERVGEPWEVEILVHPNSDVILPSACAEADTMPLAICAAIEKLIERES